MEYLTNEQRISKQKSEMNAKRLKQIEIANGEAEEKMIEANRKQGHKIKSSEADYVHVRTMERHINNDQKSFTDSFSVVKIHPREFERRVAQGAFKTYDDVEILHDPRGGTKVYDFKPEVLSNPNTSIPDAAIDRKAAEKEKKIMEAAKALDLKEKELAEREKDFQRKMQELQDLKEQLNKEVVEPTPPVAEEETEAAKATKGKK